jgi:protein TonB
MGGQPGKPKPPGDPPGPREPQRPPPVEEPPRPIPVPPVDRPPPPMQVYPEPLLDHGPWPYAERTGSAGVPRRYRSFPLLIVL